MIILANNVDFVDDYKRIWNFRHSPFKYEDTKLIKSPDKGAYLLLVDNRNAPFQEAHISGAGTHSVLYAGHYSHGLHNRLIDPEWGHYGAYLKEKSRSIINGQFVVPTDILYTYDERMFARSYFYKNGASIEPGPTSVEESLHFLFNPLCGEEYNFGKARAGSMNAFERPWQVDLRIDKNRLFRAWKADDE